MSRSRSRASAADVAMVDRSVGLACLSKIKVGVGLASVLGLTALALPSGALAIGTAPSLGTAAPFGVLASSSVTNTGPSTVGGNLGLYPGTLISGFPPGNVLGTIHDTDTVAGDAQADATTAYNTAAGEAPDVVLPSNDLTGLALDPGVYKNGSAMMLDTNGTLTLNGEGNPNSVFIFQVGSTLITGTNSTISYINGAQPCNVFWQVGSSATLGTSSMFVGTILADASITLSDTVTVDGRLLAGNGNVTLIDDTITPSDCSTPGTGGTPPGGTPAPVTTGPVTPPVSTTPVGTPVTTTPIGTPGTTSPTGTPKSGTVIGSGTPKTAKQRKARLAKQRKARLAKERKARLAKQHKARLAQERKARLAQQRKARLAKQRAGHQAAKPPIHHAGFTG